MTTNRTSEAVSKWLLNIHQSVPLGNVAFHKEQASAIAAKYQRMEEALREIAGYDETGIPSFIPVQHAQEALAFDPLSPSFHV